jgi:hypothetical protein
MGHKLKINHRRTKSRGNIGWLARITREIAAYQDARFNAELEKGKTAEELFTEAWHNKLAHPKWMREVVGVTQDSADNLIHGTDAWIICKNDERIPVQIKSSRAGLEEHRAKYPGFQGIILIIKSGYTARQIRNKTLHFLNLAYLPKSVWAKKTSQ